MTTLEDRLFWQFRVLPLFLLCVCVGGYVCKERETEYVCICGENGGGQGWERVRVLQFFPLAFGLGEKPRGTWSFLLNLGED